MLVTIAAVHPSRSRMQADWVRDLIGHSSSVVDLSGLTKQEAHAQCALVRLSGPEAYVILARCSKPPPRSKWLCPGWLCMSRRSVRLPFVLTRSLADPLAHLTASKAR
ncbi:hypothetical protein [Burkholderia sp. 8Y]|uniref:hypothetical protein n=1 Tax=Burkholderia sp. 8Y TaxID=2653133 RepID=UPI00135BD2CC|nr:hypothetical protein [Burkholderia sp. 8Y]